MLLWIFRVPVKCKNECGVFTGRRNALALGCSKGNRLQANNNNLLNETVVKRDGLFFIVHERGENETSSV